MARWQLTEPHYLNTIDTKWEFETKSRTTGRSERKQFRVPTHLDPNIETDCNYQERVGNNMVDAKIIVCWDGKGEPKDIVFEGPPTPGMLPLDDEAKEISAKFDWIPTQGLDENSQFNSFAQTKLMEFTEQLKNTVQAPQIEGMAEFMKTMAQMMQTQTQILAQLAGKKAEPEPETIVPPELVKHPTEGRLGSLSAQEARKVSAAVAEPPSARRA